MFRGSAQIIRQRTAIMCRIKRARRLPVLKCAKRVTMRRERLMRRVGVIFPDLVVPGRITMKLGRVSVMCRSRSMVPCCGLTGGHGDSFLNSIVLRQPNPGMIAAPRFGNYSCRRTAPATGGTLPPLPPRGLRLAEQSAGTDQIDEARAPLPVEDAPARQHQPHCHLL